MRRIGMVLGSCFAWLTPLAQVSSDSIRVAVERYNQMLPQEKIYLHLDKPYYVPGDTVWFKAYTMDAMAHLPDTVSKRIYVDLFRKDDGRLIQSLVLRNRTGFSHGELLLADTLKDGVYEVRAYTNWMRNFPDEYYFHRKVYVRKGNVLRDRYSTEEAALADQVADLQFFPEGGNLVGGQPNRVAFKAVNQYGRGVSIEARIMSDHGDTVATIQSQHLGMGTFNFTPVAGTKYFAKVRKPDNPVPFYLPEALKSGYTFFVDNLGNRDFIKIIVKLNAGTKDHPVILGHQRGNVIFSFQSPTEGNEFYFSLRKADIPADGVVHLTLFNGQGQPQCERLIYHDTKSTLQAALSSDKTEYRTKEAVTLSIQIKDAQGNPVQGECSLSVTDMDQVMPEANGDNIVNYLQLTSDVESRLRDVRGNIEEPHYYFDRANRNAPVHLDALLMTQGWRRFVWSDVLENRREQPPYRIEPGIAVTGTALSWNGKVSSKPIVVSLFYHPEAGTTEYYKTTTDAKGGFAFNGIDVTGDTEMMVQAVKEKGGRFVLLTADRWKRPDFTPVENPIDPLLFDFERLRHFLQAQARIATLDTSGYKGKVTLLQEVVIKSEPIQDSRRMYYDYSNPTRIAVDGLGCHGITSIFQMLQASVAGVQVEFSGGTYQATVRGKTPVYLLDGFQVEADQINTIRPCDIESIEVVKHPVAMLNAQALISFLTKRTSPNEVNIEPSKGVVMAHVQGYTVPREFYSPRYKVNEPPGIPDFRSTLYWNPAVKTDADGNARVSFWNSGQPASVRVSLEGMSQQGKPLYATYTYKVN